MSVPEFTVSWNSSELFRWELRLKLEHILMPCIQVSSQACFDSMAIMLLAFCAIAVKFPPTCQSMCRSAQTVKIDCVTAKWSLNMAAEMTQFLVTWMKSVWQESKNDRLQLDCWVLNILHLSEHTPSAPGNCSLTLQKESRKRERETHKKSLHSALCSAIFGFTFILFFYACWSIKPLVDPLSPTVS